jgi:tRNA pseudouridine55 synthase
MMLIDNMLREQQRNDREIMTGLIILNKSTGVTCARIVDAIKRLLPAGVKVGHGGTLDAFATGVLIVMIGKSTRLCERIMSWPKIYDATIELGATSKTDDPDSPPLRRDVQSISREVVEEALMQFVGAIEQRPPIFSAVKIAGKRASDRARSGKFVSLPLRTVQIYSIEILSYEWPMLRVCVKCGRGTYIRSLARDLGEKLGVGGYVKSLRRTSVGQFDVKDAVKIETLTSENLAEYLRNIDP